MVSYNSVVSISRSPAQIFPYLLETTTQSARRDLSNGSKVNVSFGIGPLKAVIGLQISTMDFGNKLAFKSYSGPITWKGEYNLADDGKGATTVSQNGTAQVQGPVAPMAAISPAARSDAAKSRSCCASRRSWRASPPWPDPFALAHADDLRRDITHNDETRSGNGYSLCATACAPPVKLIEWKLTSRVA